MMNLFSAMELGKNSLIAQQQMFQVIGHNIANVNTEGYSRQVGVMEAVRPQVLGFKSSGRGVQIQDIQAVRDRFIVGQIAYRNQLEGKNNKLNEAFATVEAIFEESSGYGISDIMTDFFNSWSDLSDRPSDIPARQSLLDTAGSMTESLNRSYYRLIEQQEVFDTDMQNLTEDINAIARDIASLNEEIAYVTGSGASADDLLDARDNRIRELSGLIGITSYMNRSNQSVTVEVGGQPLVAYNTVNELSVQKNAANSNYYDIYIDQYDSAPVNITERIENGEMEGLLLMRDTYIPAYRGELDRLTAGLVQEVNELHQQGFALDGYTNGIPFFSMTDGPGTINAGGISGTTITISGLAANISETLAVGDVISVNGQTRMITSVTDPNQVEIDEAFAGDPLDGPPATWASSWQYFNRESGTGRIALDENLVDHPERVAASADIYGETTSSPGGGTVSSAGSTLTFTSDILAQGVAEGAVIAAGGQTRRIVSISADGLTASTDTAFLPPLPGGSAWTWQNYSGAEGDNRNALSIAALMNQDTVVDSDGDGVDDVGSFHDYLHATFAKIGNDSALAEYELEANQSMLTHLENKRDEISGVSLDEEAATLIQFEKSYQAMAQYFGLINKLADVLLSIGNY